MSCGCGERVNVEDCDGMSVEEWSRGGEVSSLESGSELWLKLLLRERLR